MQVENLFEEMGDGVLPMPDSTLSAEDRTNLDSLLFSSDKGTSLDQYASALSATTGYAGFIFQAKGLCRKTRISYAYCVGRLFTQRKIGL